MESLFTVVGRPGPIEERVLAGLAESNVSPGHRVGDGVALRTLESTSGHRGAPLVFLHGRGHAAALWAPFLASFATTRRVVGIDLPGFGRSGAPPPKGRGIDYFARPVESVIASMDAPVLVGHSLGGYVALDIALARRAPIAGLVLVDPMGIAESLPLRARAYLGFGPERLAQLRGLFARRAPRADAPLRWAGDDEGDARALAALREELLRSRGTRAAAAAFANAARTHVRDRIAEIDAPTLLVWGSNDTTFPLPHAIHARAAMPRAALARVDAGHSPHLTHPGTVQRAIRGWLADAAL
ncbi:MAG: alpha/beta hydrolase [Polyangiaceae bacterium]